MPLYDCGAPDCDECQRAFGPDRAKAIAQYYAREAAYAAAPQPAVVPPLKPGRKFTVGSQPCGHFLRGDADIAALGIGNRSNLHWCPVCSGYRAWCDNCHTDHHDGGWETCNPGAYAEENE